VHAQAEKQFFGSKWCSRELLKCFIICKDISSMDY
jgi:hypothetical protein